MDVTPLIRSDSKVVQSYYEGGFMISGVAYDGGPVFVCPSNVFVWSGCSDFDGFLDSDLKLVGEFYNGMPDLMIVGGGVSGGMVLPEVRHRFRNAGVLVELMSTAAGCREYNTLLADGRSIAALMWPL